MYVHLSLYIYIYLYNGSYMICHKRNFQKFQPLSAKRQLFLMLRASVVVKGYGLRPSDGAYENIYVYIYIYIYI